MYASLDMHHLVRERNNRLLGEVRAGRLRGRLRAHRGSRSAARWVARLLSSRREFGAPRWIGEETAEKA